MNSGTPHVYVWLTEEEDGTERIVVANLTGVGVERWPMMTNLEQDARGSHRVIAQAYARESRRPVRLQRFTADETLERFDLSPP